MDQALAAQSRRHQFRTSRETRNGKTLNNHKQLALVTEIFCLFADEGKRGRNCRIALKWLNHRLLRNSRLVLWSTKRSTRKLQVWWTSVTHFLFNRFLNRIFVFTGQQQFCHSMVVLGTAWGSIVCFGEKRRNFLLTLLLNDWEHLVFWHPKPTHAHKTSLKNSRFQFSETSKNCIWSAVQPWGSPWDSTYPARNKQIPNGLSFHALVCTCTGMPWVMDANKKRHGHNPPPPTQEQFHRGGKRSGNQQHERCVLSELSPQCCWCQQPMTWAQT